LNGQEYFNLFTTVKLTKPPLLVLRGTDNFAPFFIPNLQALCEFIPRQSSDDEHKQELILRLFNLW
jgi:hypothetical protein